MSVKVVRHDGSFELQTVVLDGQTDVTVRAFETEAMPLSAQPLAVRRAALTLLWGWPYAFEMGLQLGVYRDMEVEVIFRNMFETTNELEARFQYRFLKEGIYAFGFDAGLAGGRGTKDRNAFSFGLRMLHSIVFADTLAVTASIGGLLFSDQLAFTDGNVAAELGLTNGQRDTGLALALGLSFEVGVSENVNFVLTTDAWPVRTGGKEGRLLFNEGLAGSAKNIDLRGALGLSYLF